LCVDDLAKFTELGRYWIRLGARCFITGRVGSLVMAIYRIFQTIAFEPEAIATMSAAYEEALRVLQLANRQDPITELVARKVIEVAGTGERDPLKICEQTLRGLGIARGPEPDVAQLK
jgi:hypothetical protein